MRSASWFRRNISYPLWVKKDRSPRLSYLRELEESQRFDVRRLKELQFRKLLEIVSFAYSETAHYRRVFDEHGIRPSQIHDESDFRRIPILTKDELRKRPGDFLAAPFRDHRLSSFKTGGSTGIPVEILKDSYAVELINATSLRAFRWSGWNIGEPIGMIWGNPPQDLSLKQRLRNSLVEPRIYLDTMNLTEDAMMRFVGEWGSLKPTMLRGHSHSIYVFASFCKSRGISDIRPKAIISSSMMLLEHERRGIESAFSCPVTDLYGCEEVGLIGSECEVHDGMHTDMESNYVELLDQSGQSVSLGEVGAVVVSNLVSKAMPLLRYKMGDLATSRVGQCTCGRTLPLMSNISGRVADFLVRLDGSLVAGVSLVERTLTSFPGIAQMQIIQNDLTTITLKIVRDASYSSSTEEALISEFRLSVGEQNRIRIEFVDAIPQEKSGKFRFAISHVTNPFS